MESKKNKEEKHRLEERRWSIVCVCGNDTATGEAGKAGFDELTKWPTFMPFTLSYKGVSDCEK